MVFKSLLKYLEKRTVKHEKACCVPSVQYKQDLARWGGGFPSDAPPAPPPLSGLANSRLSFVPSRHLTLCQTLGSSLSWVMRLGLLGAFNYQSNVQTHFSPETFTQAQALFRRKCRLLPLPGWIQGDVYVGLVKCSLLQPGTLTFSLHHSRTHLAKSLIISALPWFFFLPMLCK